VKQSDSDVAQTGSLQETIQVVESPNGDGSP